MGSLPNPHNGVTLRRMLHTKTKRGTIKKCAKCGVTQPITNFAKHSSSSDGRASYCNNCRNRLGAKRRKQNLAYKLRHHIHSRIIKYTYENGIPVGLVTNLERYLGYSMLQLKRHLQEDLNRREGITLRQAFDLGYHLDHIVPLSSYDIKNIGDREFLQCWEMSNLRMITAEANLAKGAKLPGDEALNE